MFPLPVVARALSSAYRRRKRASLADGGGRAFQRVQTPETCFRGLGPYRNSRQVPYANREWLTTAVDHAAPNDNRYRTGIAKSQKSRQKSSFGRPLKAEQCLAGNLRCAPPQNPNSGFAAIAGADPSEALSKCSVKVGNLHRNGYHPVCTLAWPWPRRTVPGASRSHCFSLRGFLPPKRWSRLQCLSADALI